jgi:putative SOS response-associated peptidase YedK
MPVIFQQEDEKRWLAGADTAPEDLEKFLCPYPSGEMEAYVVSSRVNKADAADDQRLIEPVKGLF